MNLIILKFFQRNQTVKPKRELPNKRKKEVSEYFNSTICELQNNCLVRIKNFPLRREEMCWTLALHLQVGQPAVLVREFPTYYDFDVPYHVHY